MAPLQHFQVYNVSGDHYDMELRNVDSASPSYVFHIAREADQVAAHATLKQGQSIAAAAVYESSHSGQIQLGEPGVSSSESQAAPLKWQQPKVSNYAEFVVSGATQQTLRWYKTFQSKRVPFRVHSQKYLEWILKDITGASVPANSSEPVGETLASFKLENPDEQLRSEFIQASKPGGETGNFVWQKDGVQADVQTLAPMVVMSLWHRDRQAFYSAPLGPGIDIKNPGRSLGNKSSGNWGWANSGGMGIQAFGGGM